MVSPSHVCSLLSVVDRMTEGVEDPVRVAICQVEVMGICGVATKCSSPYSILIEEKEEFCWITNIEGQFQSNCNVSLVAGRRLKLEAPSLAVESWPTCM